MAIYQTYVGTELKFAFTITASGFDIDDDDFEILVKGQRRSIRIPKDECFMDENDQWYFTFDTAQLGPGMVYAIITAYVPDEDFDDGVRKEVAKIDLVYIKA